MKKLALAALATVALAGCNTPNHMEGRLAVKSTIKVKTKRDKVVSIAPATYKATLDIESQSTEVDIYTNEGKHSFIVPGIRPDQHGNISMSASQLGQEFGVTGKIYETTVDIDRTVSDSCVHHYDQEYKCRNERHCVKDNAGNETCGTENVCDWEQVPVYGREPVHEVGSQDTKNADMNLVKAGKAVGTFRAAYTFRENIRSRQVVGSCTM